jgi:hypothetical protein
MFMEASSQPQVASCNSGKTGLQGYSALHAHSTDNAYFSPVVIFLMDGFGKHAKLL